MDPRSLTRNLQVKCSFLHSLRAEIYFFCCKHATSEMGDVCTQANATWDLNV